jgi:hypothetical protein
MQHPNAVVLSSRANVGKTEGTIRDMGKNLGNEVILEGICGGVLEILGGDEFKGFFILEIFRLF